MTSWNASSNWGMLRGLPPGSGTPLIGVADDETFWWPPASSEDDLVLGHVGVLVLVDQDVLESLAIVLEHVGVLAEQLDDLHQQVVEVHRPGLLKAGLVLGVYVGVLALEDVGGPRGRLRRGRSARSSTSDQAVHAAGREALRVEAEIADDVAR